MRRAASAASLGQCLQIPPKPKRAPPRHDLDRNDGHLDRNDGQRTRHNEQHGCTNIRPEEDQSLSDHEFFKSEGEEQDTKDTKDTLRASNAKNAKDTKDTEDTTSRSSGPQPQGRSEEIAFLKTQITIRGRGGGGAASSSNDHGIPGPNLDQAPNPNSARNDGPCGTASSTDGVRQRTTARSATPSHSRHHRSVSRGHGARDRSHSRASQLSFADSEAPDPRIQTEEQALRVAARHRKRREEHPTQPRQEWDPPVPTGGNESQGNIIVSYYNMGLVQKNTPSGRHVAAMLKRQPSFVFACSEATEDLKEMLEAPSPSEAAITANQDLMGKKESQYKCVLQQHVGKKYDRRAHNLRVGFRDAAAGCNRARGPRKNEFRVHLLDMQI